MTGLLFVTAQSTDVKDLNRLLLNLRDWDVASSSSTTGDSQAQEFLDRFRFVTKHNPRALFTSASHRRSSASSATSSSSENYHAHGTFPPVPPSATFVNSWVGRGVEEIEEFMNMLAKVVQHDKKESSTSASSGPGCIERRDSGYSTSSESTTESSSSPEDCYNADMYLVVDEAGLATGTATLACRRRGGNSSAATGWDRVRSVPWTEVCAAWKMVEKTKSVDALFGASSGVEQQKQGMLDVHGSRELNYQRSAGQGHLSAAVGPRDCRRRDMEVSMWRECGLV